jgi:hypothetical protein
MRNLNAVRSVVSQAIEDGAQAAGNYASLRNAMNATASYYNTFGQGVIGDILSTAGTADAPGKLSAYLGNSTKARAAADAFGTAVTKAGGADGLNSALADYLRQDYLLARSEGGPNAGVKWAQNHDAFLSGAAGQEVTEPFARLRDDVTKLNQADAVLPQLSDAAKRDQDSVDVHLAKTFLGAGEGKELEAALRGPNPAGGMQSLVALTRQDPTGQAFRGLQRMLFDRTMAAAQKYDAGGTPYYSGQAAQAFLQANRGAFSVMRQADPVVGANLDKLINGLAAEDAIRARPPVAGLPKDLSSAAPLQEQGIASKVVGAVLNPVARMIGAKFGRDLDTGTIQVPGIMANQAGALAEGAYKSLTGREAPQVAAITALRNAMFDPAKTQEYLDAQAKAWGDAGLNPLGGPLGGIARGTAAGNRAAAGASQIDFSGNGQPPSDTGQRGTFSPAHPWVRATGIEAAHSALNSDQVTPEQPHKFPPPRTAGNPWRKQ